MPRLISMAKTVEAVEARRKTVTRRDGWQWLTPGTILEAVDKSPRAGQGFRRLCLIRVLSVRRERLGDVTAEEVRREGFPEVAKLGDGVARQWFATLYCDGRPDYRRAVTRIEFEYVDEGAP